MSTYKDFYQNAQCRLVTGPSNVQPAGKYVCTFQPGNFTGCGSEGVKTDSWPWDKMSL